MYSHNEINYVYLQDIQNYKIEFHTATGCGIDMYDTARALFQDGRFWHGKPQIPDMLSWNLHNLQNLKELVLKIPVNLDDVLSVRHEKTSSVLSSSTKYRVQISLEACYTGDHFMSVDYFAIAYVLQGSCQFRLQHSTRIMQAGELCIIPPNLPYYVMTTPEDFVIYIISDKPHFEENFQQLLAKDNLLSSFFRSALFQNAHNCLFFMMPPEKEINTIIQHLFAEYLSQDALSEVLFNTNLLLFYAQIIRCSERSADYYSVREGYHAKEMLPAILNYIKQHYHTLTLSTLASHFNYENGYMCKMIKEFTGSNFGDLITELKLLEAKELLSGTDMPIESVAEISGYNSPAYFASAFKKAIGMTPRQYRNHMENE